MLYRGLRIQQPEVDIGGDDGGEGEGDADAAEVAGLDLVAFAAQDADAGDVGRSADRRAVAAQRRAREQAEVEQRGVDAQRAGQAGDDRQHGGDVGDVVDKGGEQHRRPDDDRVDHKDIAAAHARQQARGRVDDAHVGDAADDQEQAEQQADGLKVDRLDGAEESVRAAGAGEGIDHADDEQRHADQAVGDVGLDRDERGRDQQRDHAHKQDGGHIVGHGGQLTALFDGVFFLAEQPGQDQRRGNGAELDRKEDARAALVPEEIEEAHVRIGAEHDGRGIAHKRGRALQVGGDGNADDERDRVGLELFADGQRDRRDHEHGGDVIHKSRDDAREQRQRHGGHLHVGHLEHDHIGQAGRHAAVNEQLHQAHRARDHQQHVPVDRAEDLVKRQHAGGDEDHRRAQRDVGAVFGEGQHQNIGNGKQDQSIDHSHTSFPGAARQFFCIWG